MSEFKHYILCLACLKQQRSLAFLSSKSLGIFPSCFLGTKCACTLKVNFYLVMKEVNKFKPEEVGQAPICIMVEAVNQ